VLREASKFGDFDLVTFTGGEPTLHPELAEIAGLVAVYGFSFGFVTNAWHFDRTLEQIAPHRDHLDHITFSLDGSTEATHDEIRRRPGSFRRVMQALSRCRHEGITARINMVVTTANRDELEAMAVLASRLGCAGLAYGHCQPTADALAAGLVPSLDDRGRIEAEIASIQKIFALDIFLAGDHRTSSPFHRCPQLRLQEVNVDYRGRVTACCILSSYRGGTEDTDVVADLHDVSFFEAHRRLIAKVAQINQEKIDRLEAGEPREADRFMCTHCLEHYDKVPDVAAALSPALVSIGASTRKELS